MFIELSYPNRIDKTLIADLAPTSTNTNVNFDFTDLFKNNFATFGEGNFTINYDLLGSDASSFATFNNVKLALEVPEPTTTVAGFVALALAAGAMQRKRKVVNGIKVNS